MSSKFHLTPKDRVGRKKGKRSEEGLRKSKKRRPWLSALTVCLCTGPISHRDGKNIRGRYYTAKRVPQNGSELSSKGGKNPPMSPLLLYENTHRKGHGGKSSTATTSGSRREKGGLVRARHLAKGYWERTMRLRGRATKQRGGGKKGKEKKRSDVGTGRVKAVGHRWLGRVRSHDKASCFAPARRKSHGNPALGAEREQPEVDRAREGRVSPYESTTSGYHD